MRYLHAVGLSERFLASGAYITDANVLVEQWTAHALPDGAWLIRVDRIPQNILLEAWRSSSGAIERVDAFRLQSPTLRVTYMRGDSPHILDHSHKEAQTEAIYNSLTIPVDSIITLPGILGAGFALSEFQARTAPIICADLPSLEVTTHTHENNAAAWAVDLDAHGIPQTFHDGEKVVNLRDYVPHKTLNLRLNR